MKNRTLLCFLCIVLAAASGCGKKKPRPRVANLAVVATTDVCDRPHGGFARTDDGTLFAVVFLSDTFPSATGEHDALRVYASHNAGETWRDIAAVKSSVTYPAWGCDLTSDGEGLHLAWIASMYDPQERRPYKAIMYARSTNGGRSWTAPACVSKAAGQRRAPAIAADGTRVVVAWLDTRQAEGGPDRMREDVFCSVSSDNGATWPEAFCAEVELAQKTSSSGAPSVLLDGKGDALIAYSSIRATARRGRFWTARVPAGSGAFSVQAAGRGPYSDVCLIEADGRLCLAAVYISGIRQITMQNPQTFQEIHCHTSDDGGETWSDPALIDDDPNHEHKSAVRMASLGGGRLVACWHDERGAVYAAASEDPKNHRGKSDRADLETHDGVRVFEHHSADGVQFVERADLLGRHGEVQVEQIEHPQTQQQASHAAPAVAPTVTVQEADESM